MPTVTVVIPTRNRRAKLSHAVKTVQQQSFTTWELVIVDDASTDDTWEWVCTLRDTRIRGERVAQRGERSHARNRGLELAGGDAVLFLDDDDGLEPNALADLTGALDQHSEACMSVGALRAVEDSGRRQPAFPRRTCVLTPVREVLAGWVAVGGQVLIRTAVVHGIGGYREDLNVAEDQDLWLRLIDRGPSVFVPSVVLEHHPHGLSNDDPAGVIVEQQVRSAYIERQSGRRRQSAERAAAARANLREADISAQRGEFRHACGAMLRGLRRSPYLLVSPLTGPGLRRGLAHLLLASCLPPSVAVQLRQAARAARSAQLTLHHSGRPRDE